MDNLETRFDTENGMYKSELVDTRPPPTPGTCRGCKYEPAWWRMEGIGGQVYHEGRCRKRKGLLRAGAIAGCSQWAAKVEGKE